MTADQVKRGGELGWLSVTPPTGAIGLGAAVGAMVAVALAHELMLVVDGAFTCQKIWPSGRLAVGTNLLFAVVVETSGLEKDGESSTMIWYCVAPVTRFQVNVGVLVDTGPVGDSPVGALTPACAAPGTERSS